MDHRSRNFSKSSASYTHSSLERQHGQRVGNHGDWQRASSLERHHRNRTGNSLDRQQGVGSSLEHQQRGWTGSSQERQQFGSSSLERQHRNRTGNSLEQQQGGNIRPGGRGLDGDHRCSPKDGKESQKKHKHQAGAEKKAEELSRQLEEERMTSRRTIAKLQRDLARLKSERTHNQRDGREGVVKELERERMLRVDTEQRLHDMRVESDSCRARLHALQDEFRKMEEMVRDMMQYKIKIDQLKQEKASLAVTYENNLQKCRNHISTLERENMMLLNQVKKTESQLHGKGDDRDKSRLLLERLKMVEAENSGLVLENEQQRQQYEKCLDQIANQVVQALLAQKTLREECIKLQNRVHDLELQNRQLNLMFQQRIRFPSDPTMQHMPYSSGSTYVYRAEAGRGEVTSAQFLQGSAISLQSMFSETMFDDAPGHPQMSTPPPWLRDRLELPLDDEVSLSSSSTGSPTSPSNPPHRPTHQATAATASKAHSSPSTSSAPIVVPGMTTKIETEFPATNTSPKMKHVNVFEQGTRSLERSGAGFRSLLHSVGPARGSTGSMRKSKVRRSSDTQAVNQLSEQAWQKLEAQVMSQRKSLGKKSASAEAVGVQASAQRGPPAAAQRGSGSPTSAQTGVPASAQRASALSASTQRGSPASSQRGSGSPADTQSGSATSAAGASGGRTGGKATNIGTGKAGPAVGKNGDDVQKSSLGKASGGSGAARFPHTSPMFGKVKLRRRGSGSSRDSSQSPHRQAARNSMPPSMPFHSQYYYDYSDEDSDSRPVSRVYSCASTVSLNELLDTSAEGDFALDDDFFSDWSSMCLSPQHRLPIHPTHPPLLQASQGQSSQAGQGQSNPTTSSPRSAAASPNGSNLHRKLLSQGLSPLVKGGAEQRQVGSLKAERDDSGCEVEPSHSDRSESWQSNITQGAEVGASESNIKRDGSRGTKLGVSLEVGAVVQVAAGDGGTDSPHCGKASSVPASDAGLKLDETPSADLSARHAEDVAAVVCKVSLASKSATKIQLPSPQAAVLITEPGWGLSDSEQPSASESSCAVFPDKPQPATAAGRASPSLPASEAKKENLTSSGSSKTSASDMPFSADLIASVISREALGGSAKLKSQPLSAEEKSRACRPDQLILAPADKNFSVHGFTSSSSSSCEDRSPMKLQQLQVGDKNSVQCSGPVSAMESPSGNSSKPKKTPPPVPHKPFKPGKGASSFTSVAQVELSSASVNSSSGVSDTGSSISDNVSSGGGGKFPPETTLTVGFMSVQSQQLDHIACNPDTVRDFVNSLVKDMKERVARHSDWPITSSAGTAITTTTSTHSYCKSLDSSFESLRAERSGSKDDGYSTMSSDIHPVAMDKYSYPETVVTKPGVEAASSARKASEVVHDHSSRVESLKRRDKSIEMSETDSAMETSAHSMDTRNSSQSLSSQVSSSSGENVLSPGAKVTRMTRFFEDEASKRSESTPTTTTIHHHHHHHHHHLPATPSPLSPSGQSSVGSLDSSLCLSPNGRLAGHSSVTSPDSDESSRQMCASVVSQPCAGRVTSSVSVAVSATISTTVPRVSSPVSSSVGQRIQDLVQNFQAGLSEKTITTPAHSFSLSSPSHAHRPSDFRFSPEKSGTSMRATVCDFRKYEITDLSKLNVSGSYTPVSATRRENVMSWPPRKAVPLLSSPSGHSPMPHLDYSAPCQVSGWEPVTSPLHMNEDKILDDIPEESGDEWDNLHIHSTQERQQQQLQQQQRDREVKSASRSSRASTERSGRCLRKAKSETNLGEKPRVASLYDEMMSGSWDSGKVLERSASVSEVDFRSRSVCAEERVLLHRSFRHISLDENDINQRVALLLGKPRTPEESDSEVEAKKQLNDLWKTLMSQRPRQIPEWRPKESAEALKQTCTPSPIAVQKMGGSNPEDWILGFTKEEIEKHTAAKPTARGSTPRANNRLVPQGKNVTGLDLSHLGLEGESKVLEIECGHSREEEDADSSECSPRSPSEEQKLFHSEFYSLCPMESNRSLASSNCSMYERSTEQLNEGSGAAASSSNPISFQSRLPHPTDIMEGIHSREFDEISNQIASLSRTVDELNRSLNSLTSGGSGGSTQDLQHSGLTEESQRDEASGGGAWSASRQECIDGYHWVEDEFYLTTCGGEVIIGSAALLAEEEGMEDYCEDGAGEEGGMFSMEDNDDAIADDAQDDFYCIRMPRESSSRAGTRPVRPVSGGCDVDHILNSLAQFRYNSDGQLSRQQGGGGGAGGGAAGLEAGWSMESSSSYSCLSQVMKATTLSSAKVTACEDNVLADKQHRANLLDSMLPSGGESNDSLSSDIGLDHMMCQRLMGRKGKMDVVRFALPKQRPPLDLSQFFIRYGKPEQEAVAAFDFLEDISTSESMESLAADGSWSRRARSASQPLSREAVMRQTQVMQQREAESSTPAPRSSRPLSESDFMKFRLPPGAATAPHFYPEHRHPSYHLPKDADNSRGRNFGVRGADGGSGGLRVPSGSTPPPRRHKLRRRRKKSEVKDKGQGKGSAVSDQLDSAAGGGGKVAAPHRSGRGSRGRKGGERARREWHDIKVGDVVTNTLSLSDSCCDSSSSPSPPSLSHTDLSKF